MNNTYKQQQELERQLERELAANWLAEQPRLTREQEEQVMADIRRETPEEREQVDRLRLQYGIVGQDVRFRYYYLDLWRHIRRELIKQVGQYQLSQK